jgi:NAD(P)-dependent dehydrogenase (short-subunit alcohol dehydrogenase family)
LPLPRDGTFVTLEIDYSDEVVLVTGASGALGSAVAAAFADAGATVAAADVVAPDDEDALLDADRRGIGFYGGDFTDEADVAETVSAVVDDHGRLDALCNIAGTWRGGDPLHETDAGLFDVLLDVNLKTMFLASKHAIPHLQETQGAVVSVSARSSLEGGEGDGIYRASKAGVRLLTETIAEENLGTVRANAIMPSVIDTPTNREMMPEADPDEWVDPADIAEVVMFLCSDGATVTSGAAVPVYGEA